MVIADSGRQVMIAEGSARVLVRRRHHRRRPAGPPPSRPTEGMITQEDMSPNEGHTRALTAGRAPKPACGRRGHARAVAIAAMAVIVTTLTIAIPLATTPAASAAEGSTGASQRQSSGYAQGGAYTQRGVHARRGASSSTPRRTSAGAWARTARAAGARDPAIVAEHTRLLKLARA